MNMESQDLGASLTPKQKQVLDFITGFARKEGYSPTLKEIASYLRKSLPTAQHFVEELERKGYIDRTDHLTRGITPTEEGSTDIPLFGYIAAGEPIEPIENPEPIAVPQSMISKNGQYYALQVRGDSMIEEGILDGDTVVIQHQITAQDGDTIVAITERGATLKILRKRNDKVYLEPRNAKLENIYPEELEVRGKFVGLIRK
jgi:SOS regulatory protein LexA